jgi:hypothetical protein
VFGDLPQANGDPNLVMYGRDISPNHHALAEKYVLLDNFYTGGAISFDGHQWLMQAFVSDYVGARFRRLAARLRLEYGRRAHRFAAGNVLAIRHQAAGTSGFTVNSALPRNGTRPNKKPWTLPKAKS